MTTSKSFVLKFIPKEGYLHIIVTGINNKNAVREYLKEIFEKCKERNYSRVLIEENLEGQRLNLMDVFKIISEAGSRSVGSFKSIAYVDVNAENDSMKFAETVAVNRTIPVTVFSTLQDAEKWLQQKISRLT